MDLQTMETEVRERVGEITADFYTQAEVYRAINEAIKRFSTEERWPWLFTEFSTTLASGSDEISLPADVSLTRTFALSVTGGSIGTTGGRMLERVTPMEGFRLRFMYDDHPSVPRWYYVSKTNLEADDEPPITYTARTIPVADASYDVEGLYMFVPIEISAVTDEPAVPEEYQEAIVAWAAGKLLLKELQISQKAGEQFAMYEKVLEMARNDVKEFSADEVVAWGRSHPLGRRFAGGDPRVPRTSPTLGS